MAQKPPLGVAPKWLRQEQRLEELCGAIIRYRQGALPIPDDLLEEVRELSGELLARSKQIRHCKCEPLRKYFRPFVMEGKSKVCILCLGVIAK